jgi:hypothetical protein
MVRGQNFPSDVKCVIYPLGKIDPLPIFRGFNPSAFGWDLRSGGSNGELFDPTPPTAKR